MAKNLDHSTSSSQPTPRRQSFESAVARFLERRRTDDVHDGQDASTSDAATEVDANDGGPEIVIVDPIEKTQESPVIVPPEPARRGGVPAFLAQGDTHPGIEDTSPRAVPLDDIDAEPIEGEDVYDEGYDDAYDDDGFAYNGYDDEYYEDEYAEGYYEDYGEAQSARRGMRRGAVAALVAAVAAVSFVAGGLAVRHFTPATAAPTEKAPALETQASLTEKPEQNSSETVVEPTDDTKKSTPTSTNNTVKLHTDKKKTTAPTYDTGDDTTDDSKSTDNTKKQTDSSKQDNSSKQTDSSNDTDTTKQRDQQDDDTWSWNLDEKGDNSISYDRGEREMTFDYDGYKLTVPMGDLVDQYEQTYDTNKTNRNTTNTRDNTGYHGYDFGSDGYGSEWTRNRSDQDYQRKYTSWS